MQKNNLDIKLVSIGLAFIYCISLLFGLLESVSPNMHALGIVIFAILFISAVGTFFLKEWARNLTVIVSSFLAGYFTYQVFSSPALTPCVLEVFLTLLAVLFFSKKSVGDRFIQENPLVINAPRTIKGQPASWKSILVIDDDETLTHLVRPILMKNGYSVLIAATGEEGLSIAQKQKPHLILLDVILPKIKGREVCRQLKANHLTAKIPVIFLTAKDSPDDIKAEMAIGAETHLTKPVNTALLLSTIERVLSK